MNRSVRLGGAGSLCLLAACWTVSCSGGNAQQIAGKPAGSETSEEIAARVLDSQGQPVTDAEVRLRSADYATDPQSGVKVPDGITDSTGRFQLKLPSDGRWILEVRGKSNGVILPFQSTATQGGNFNDLVARPFGSLHGRVTLPTGVKSGWVQLFGLDRLEATDSNGNFKMAGLPPTDSTIDLRVLRSDNLKVLATTPVRIQSGQDLDLGGLNPTVSFALADFETGLWVNTPCHCTRWNVIDMGGATNDPVDTVSRSPDHPGKFLHISYNAKLGQYVRIVADLGGARDLSELDSVAITYRGYGSFGVALVENSETPPGWGLDSPMDTLWHRVVLRMSELSWYGVSSGPTTLQRIKSFEVRAYGNNLYHGEISIDDIQFYGISNRNWR